MKIVGILSLSLSLSWPWVAGLRWLVESAKDLGRSSVGSQVTTSSRCPGAVFDGSNVLLLPASRETAYSTLSCSERTCQTNHLCGRGEHHFPEEPPASHLPPAPVPARSFRRLSGSNYPKPPPSPHPKNNMCRSGNNDSRSLLPPHLKGSNLRAVWFLLRLGHSSTIYWI